MKKTVKRLLAVLLAVAMAFSTCAISGVMAANALANSLSVEIISDKTSYGLMDTSKVTVRVKNNSIDSVSNVLIETYSKDLSYVNNSGDKSKYIFNLSPNEDVELSFDVILSTNSSKTNFFQKILVFFNNIFKRSSNFEKIDSKNVIKNVTSEIRFSSVNAEISAVISFVDSNTITDIELAEMKKVDEEISRLISTDEFSANTISEQKNAVTELLEEFEDEQVQNNSIFFDSNSKVCSFTYSNGVLGGVYLGEFKEHYNINAQQKSVGIINTQAVDLATKDALILFSFNTKGDDPEYREPFYSSTQKYWETVGLNTVVDKSVTIKDLKNIDNDYEIVCISGHGTTYRSTPIIVTTEKRTDTKDKEYAADLKNNRIASLSFVSDPENKYYCAFPSLFSAAYGSEGLNGKFVFSEACCFLGEFGRYNYSFADTLVACGAEAVIGFHNSVLADYSRDFMKYWVDSLCTGKTAKQAYDSAVSVFGSSDGQTLNPAVPKFVGDENASFIKQVYNITYSANGGTVSPTRVSVEAGNSVTLPTPKKTCSLYYNANGGQFSVSSVDVSVNCKGWSTSGTVYSCGAKYYPSKTVTLYAVWDSGNTTISTSKPTRSGYTFVGWSTSSSTNSVQYYAGSTISISSNTTLYAVWSKNETTIAIPNLVGQNYSTARTTLENLGLNVSLSLLSNYDYTKSHGEVVSQSHSAGSQVTVGSTVTLYVSRGPKPFEKNDMVEFVGGDTYGSIGGTVKYRDASIVYLTGDVSGEYYGIKYVKSSNTRICWVHKSLLYQKTN
ncbi:MAG: InlB B-repeat-containing protein [Clostridia bacterium]|nr:InlB B-repeat-containing protein [Clostridia bacterium]